MEKNMNRLALVLSAGGARGAYEAGVIYYIRMGLPKKTASRNFEILTGTSVGAMNTCGMASTAQDPQLQGKSLKEMWFSLNQSNIYRRDISATTHFLGSTLGGIMRNFLTFNPFHIASRKGPHFESFLDTAPLKEFLTKVIAWPKIEKNILQGPVDAVALSVTNLNNGSNELFFQKKPSVVYRGHYVHHEGALKPEHAIASAAIPIIFPPEKIGKTYYADGGLRLFTPISPAIQLGADRLIVVGMRKRPKPMQPYKGGQRISTKTPTIAEQLGRMLNGLFLDRIEFDMEQLDRINTIIDISEKIYGKNFLEKINERMKKESYKTDIATRGLKKIEGMEIQPSEFVNNIFLRWFQKGEKGHFKFSALEKILVRLLDIDPTSGSDLLSYLIFAPQYIRDLFDLGYEDAKRKKDRLVEIMDG
jgi:NTE family protein